MKRYKNIKYKLIHNKIIHNNRKDVEFNRDVELKKNTPNTRTRVSAENYNRNNMNHLRNKQLY